MKKNYYFLFLTLLFFGCAQSPEKAPLFKKITSESGIDFSNTLTYTEEFNPYTYRNFYNGGGVALADIDNDGLLDIYFTGNIVGNKLYRNTGNWKFEDITGASGTACEGVWSSGATFVDINSDGFVDLYVCKSGKPEGENRQNEFFINKGNGTFESIPGAFGLGVLGLSTHAAFFDYDRDGDLDCYLLTNSIRSLGAFDFIKDQRNIPDENGNKLFRNDNGQFVEVTTGAGIFSSKIGFGLGITLSDFNHDGWPDIFISNDFFERDYLYLNNQDGTFSEQLEGAFQSISMGSMGSDAADLNNDQSPDLIVTEMLPQTIERVRTKTVFESWDKYQMAVSNGYFHQFSRNVLQQNVNGKFLEIGRMAGVSATEWSWAALIFDMDNDGLKDIYVSNGIYKDLLDRDYLAFTANEENVRAILREKNQVIKQLIDIMPSAAVPNQTFRNKGNFQFQAVSDAWGLGEPSFSNGSAYGDLDNDGDLDLVVNNVNMPAFLYQNQTDTSTNRSLRIRLSGKAGNTFGIGAKVEAFANGNAYLVENFPSKGFESSVDPILHLGLGGIKVVDSLWVTWASGWREVHYQIPTNTLLNVEEKNADASRFVSRPKPVFALKPDLEVPIRHMENDFVDFDRDRLLVQMMENTGPSLAAGDVNGDGLEDVVVGGAKGFATQVALRNGSSFAPMTSEALEADKMSEDTNTILFDCDGDGDLDLYVCSGGKSFSSSSSALRDRLYLNDGNGKYSPAPDRLPFKDFLSNAAAAVADVDADGDLDLFVGERFHPFHYGQPVRGFILINDGRGYFSDETETLCPALMSQSMITDAKWADLNSDNQMDLLLATDWGSLQLFLYENGKWVDRTNEYGLTGLTGWWNTLQVVDFDGDGDRDIVAGNHGLNSFFKDSTRIYIADFDNNGSREYVYCHRLNGGYFPVADRDELVAQMPSLRKKILHFSDFAAMKVEDLFSAASLSQSLVLDASVLESSVFINEVSQFSRRALPLSLQYAPIYAICAEDVNMDGFQDLVFGGNHYLVKPKFGRYDAQPVTVWLGSSDGFKDKDIHFTSVMGQVRDLEFITIGTKRVLVVGKNNEKVETYAFEF